MSDFDPDAFIAQGEAAKKVVSTPTSAIFDPDAFIAQGEAAKKAVSKPEHDKDEDRRHETSGGTPTKKPSLWDRVVGAGEAALATATGLLAGAAAPAVGLTAIPGEFLDENFHKDVERIRKEAKARHTDSADMPTGVDIAANEFQKEHTYQPRTEEGRRQTAALSEKISPVANELAKLPVGSGETQALASLAKPALKQAVGAVAPEAEALGRVGRAAQNVVGKGVTPLSPEATALADKALSMGIKIPPHMLSKNEFVRMAGEFVDNLPLSGSTKLKNKEAFNSYLAKQIGVDEPVKALTPAVYARAMRKSGAEIGEVFSSIKVPADDPVLVKELSELVKQQKTELPEVGSVINGYVQELSEIASKNDGTIPGTTLKDLHSKVGAKLRSDLSSHPGLKSQLSDFQEVLENAADRQITDPEMREQYQTARVRYAKGKILTNLVAENDTSGVNPNKLLGRMNATAEGKNRMAHGAAGDLGEAAAIATNFMREEPVSKAAGRGFVLGAVTEAAGLGKAALGLVAGNVYNRFGPLISKRIVEMSRAVNKTAEEAKAPKLELEEGEYHGGSPFPPKPPPTRGLLTAEQAPLNIAHSKDTHLGAEHRGNTMDFPLRQEVLNSPEIEVVTTAFREEAARLEQEVKTAQTPTQRKQAMVDLRKLKNDFGAGMKQLGVVTPQDATGLRRPLYEAAGKTQLPIKKVFTPGEQAP